MNDRQFQARNPPADNVSHPRNAPIGRNGVQQRAGRQLGAVALALSLGGRDSRLSRPPSSGAKCTNMRIPINPMNPGTAAFPTGPVKVSDKDPMQHCTVALRSGGLPVARRHHHRTPAQHARSENPQIQPHEPRHGRVPDGPGQGLRQRPHATWHGAAPVRRPASRAPSPPPNACPKCPNRESANQPHEPWHGRVPDGPGQGLRQSPHATWHGGASVRKPAGRAPAPPPTACPKRTNRESAKQPHEPWHGRVPDGPGQGLRQRPHATWHGGAPVRRPAGRAPAPSPNARSKRTNRESANQPHEPRHGPVTGRPRSKHPTKPPCNVARWRPGPAACRSRTRAIAFQNRARSLARYVSSHPARLNFPRREPLEVSFCMRFRAMCRNTARLYGPCPNRVLS